MKKTNCLFTLWVAALCAGTHAYAVGTAPAILSNYGEIQSVKNYSSNPFWNKNSPYNQNFPKPIYATGADLNTGDCNRVVENLVTSYCAEHNYCRNLRISDVRPTIMVQLSQLPGHNFATSCGGYIDSAFDKFQKEYGNVSTVNLPKPASQPTNIEIANPFAPKQTAAQKAVADRTAELERLQSITTPTTGVHAEYFPKTTADLSFTDRIANTAAGYEPYKDKPSYKKPDFLGEDEAFFERLKAQNFEEFCNRRPTDPECKKWYCEQHPDDKKCKKASTVSHTPQKKQPPQPSEQSQDPKCLTTTNFFLDPLTPTQDLNLCITSNFQTLNNQKYYSKSGSLSTLHGSSDYGSVFGAELSELIDDGIITSFVKYTDDGSDWPSYLQNAGKWAVLVATTCEAMTADEYDKETIIIGESSCSSYGAPIISGELSGPYCYCRLSGRIAQGSNDVENITRPWGLVFYEDNKHLDSTGNCIENAQKALDTCKYTCTKQCLGNFINGDRNLYIPMYLPTDN